jgi:hypothetical protein
VLIIVFGKMVYVNTHLRSTWQHSMPNIKPPMRKNLRKQKERKERK